MRSSGGQQPLQGGSHPLPRRLCQEGGQGWKGGRGGRARVTAFPAWGVELSRVLSGSGWTLKGPGRAEPHSHLSVAHWGNEPQQDGWQPPELERSLACWAREPGTEHPSLGWGMQEGGVGE